jgi:hypothetical protein
MFRLGIESTIHYRHKVQHHKLMLEEMRGEVWELMKGEMWEAM